MFQIESTPNLSVPQRLETAGFVLISSVLAIRDCDEIAAGIDSIPDAVGSRCLLDQEWCAALARRLKSDSKLSQIIPSDHVAVQCTGFEKSSARNWLVAFHQDLSIPVARQINDSRLRGWSRKENSLFVQPPLEVLEQLTAVRVHLDSCLMVDGPLRVVPGSHQLGRLDSESAVMARKKHGEVVCELQRGGILAMRPLL
jgi:hypothetical protein